MFNWPKDKPIPPNPYTREGEKEVQRILHPQSIANNAPDGFVDTFNMKVSDINPTMNVLARILIGKSPTHVLESQRKRGRRIGAKDKQLRKRKPTTEAKIEVPIVSNRTISEESLIANYANSKLITQQEVNDIFIFYVTTTFVNELDPQTIQ